MSAFSQIQKYRAAVGKPSVGSRASRGQISNAVQTSLGRNRSASLSSTPKASSPAKSGKPKGSWEGYQGGNSTYIQMNGSGYDSVSKVRGTRRNTTIPRNTTTMTNVKPMRRSSFDYTYGSGRNSSSSILRKQQI